MTNDTAIEKSINNERIRPFERRQETEPDQ